MKLYLYPSWQKSCFFYIFICIFFLQIQIVFPQDYYQPEQIHLSYGEKHDTMVVTWVTLNQTDSSVVEYGINSLNLRNNGFCTVFVDGGSEHRKLYIHKVYLRPLKPNFNYIYHVGSSLGWSQIYYFKSPKVGENWNPRLALFGDMGNKNARSLSRLQEETQRGHFDAILHVGDFAYNMDTDNARFGDAFMNQIQSVAAYVPYMTCVGNHENAYNFSNYRSRFSMPKADGDGQNMFYSFNIGPAHIVMFSSEYYYYTSYGFEQIVNQYKWLDNDLREANKPENRKKRPWIISLCHRPLYCSNKDDSEHCTNKENIIRVGFPYVHVYGIEQLLYKYNVDLNFQAHEHSYERMWPVYNLTVCNGSSSNPYKNPAAPVHIVTGSAGCQEGQDPFERFTNPWSAYHSDDYGYTRLHIANKTHIFLEQVSDNKNGSVIDRMVLIKDKINSFSCH